MSEKFWSQFTEWINLRWGRGGGQGVSMLTISFNDPSLNPAEICF